MSFLSEIKEVSEEVTKNDLESNQGGGFIKEGGVYEATIDKAFISQTKKKGLQLDLMFSGENMHNETLYIATRNKNKELVSTCVMQGKTVTLPSFKLFKQLMFVATGEPIDLSNIKTTREDVKYKKFGKDVVVEADVIDDLIGKKVMFAIRQSEQYAYDKEAGETDKTQLRVNSDGDTLYQLDITEFYNEDGFTAIEMIKGEEVTKSKDNMEKFLSGDKAIKKVKLEMPEIEEAEEDEDDEELEF